MAIWALVSWSTSIRSFRHRQTFVDGVRSSAREGLPPLYLSRLAKLRPLRGMGTDWRAPKVRAASRGLANVGPATSRFRNIFIAVRIPRVIRRATISSEFGRIVYIAFVLSCGYNPRPFQRYGPPRTLDY